MPFSHTLLGGEGGSRFSIYFVQACGYLGCSAGPIEPFSCSDRGPRMKNITIAVIFFFSYR